MEFIDAAFRSRGPLTSKKQKNVIWISNGHNPRNSEATEKKVNALAYLLRDIVVRSEVICGTALLPPSLFFLHLQHLLIFPFILYTCMVFFSPKRRNWSCGLVRLFPTFFFPCDAATAFGTALFWCEKMCRVVSSLRLFSFILDVA